MVVIRPSHSSSKVSINAGNTSSTVQSETTEQINSLESGSINYWNKTAKEWAIKMDGQVEGTDYSSKYWAKDSATQATLAGEYLDDTIEVYTSVQSSATEAVSVISEATSDSLGTISSTTTEALNTISGTTTEALETISQATTTALEAATSASESAGSASASATEAARIAAEVIESAPRVTVTETTTGATINVEDIHGTSSADIDDGFSPSASVEKVGNKATITITDKDGTTTAEIYDGAGGASSFSQLDGSPYDNTNLANALNDKQDVLTAGTGIDITNNVISNTQTSAEWGNIEGDISDQTDLQEEFQNVREVAEGKTKSYVVSKNANPAFDTQDADFQLTETFIDINNNIHNVSELKLGDNIYVIETDVPDRWCGELSTSTILPAEYTQLEYIENSNAQKIIFSDAASTYDDIVECGFGYNPTTTGLGRYIWGQESNGGGARIEDGNGGIRCAWSSGQWTDTFFEYNVDSLNIMTMDKTSLVINGVETTNYNRGSSFGVYGLFYWMNNTQKPGARIYYFKVTRDNVKIIDAIPARRDSDNVVGMYDTVTGDFFTNVGKGNFITGQEITTDIVTLYKLETSKVDLTPYQTKTDNKLTTTDKTIVGAINEVNAKPSMPSLDEETITTNTDDELQAIGVIEKNAGNVKYDWVGTLAEYTAQDIETLHPEWVCFITDDVSGGDGLARIEQATLDGITDVEEAVEEGIARVDSIDSLKYNRVTNCLTEIPQKIKLELNEGVLTLKAGSIITVPYGTTDLSGTYPIGSEFLHPNFKVYDRQFADGLFFVWAEVQEDISSTWGTLSTSSDRYPGIDMLQNDWVGGLYTESGTSSTSLNKYTIYYNTSDNKNYYTSNTTVVDNTRVLSFPITRVSLTEGILSSIAQIFNGIGYIGSTVWVDKGVKGLIPNDRNADGSLKNIEFETESVLTKTDKTRNYNEWITIELENNKLVLTYSNQTAWSYNPELNIGMGTNKKLVNMCMIGRCITTNGVISNFQAYPAISINSMCDGQWVYTALTAVASGTPYPTTNNMNIDLSDYLPKDNYNYEVYVCVRVDTGKATGNSVAAYIASSIIQSTAFYAIGVQTPTNYSIFAETTVPFPIGTDRVLTVVATSNSVGTFRIYLRGYRRLGTNN